MKLPVLGCGAGVAVVLVPVVVDGDIVAVLMSALGVGAVKGAWCSGSCRPWSGLESTPPVAAVLARIEIGQGASLKVKWTVEELAWRR